jgi:hypothetical protein
MARKDATEECVTSTVTSRNNRRVVASCVLCGSARPCSVHLVSAVQFSTVDWNELVGERVS